MKTFRPQHPALDLFERLLPVPAPPGGEVRMANCVRAELNRIGVTHETDDSGNLVIRTEGKGESTLVMAAHLDEIGFEITHVEADGRLRFHSVGLNHIHKMGERPVEILLPDGGSLAGVVSTGAGHRREDAPPVSDWGKLSVITGHSKAQLDRFGVGPGTFFVPHPSVRGPVYFGPEDDPMIGAWTFDDRLCVSVLLLLLESIRRGEVMVSRPVTFVFTTHEEGGCFGARAFCERERPEIFIALDGCPVPTGSDLVLDGSPGAWLSDRHVTFDPGILEELNRAATAAGTRLQTCHQPQAINDASAAAAEGHVVRPAIVGHVRENSHGFEVTRASAFPQLLETLKCFVTALPE